MNSPCLALCVGLIVCLLSVCRTVHLFRPCCLGHSFFFFLSRFIFWLFLPSWFWFIFIFVFEVTMKPCVPRQKKNAPSGSLCLLATKPRLLPLASTHWQQVIASEKFLTITLKRGDHVDMYTSCCSHYGAKIELGDENVKQYHMYDSTRRSYSVLRHQ